MPNGRYIAFGRNRHQRREADLLPLAYYHVVFTLPAPISAIAYTNKAVIYGLLFDLAAETLRTMLPTRSIWVPISVPPWCCTPGDRR